MSRTTALVIALVMSPLVLSSQGRTLATGDRVRVTARLNGTIIHTPATVVRSAEDTLVLDLPGGWAPPIALPLDDIQRIEISGGLHSDAGRGALVGLGIGALTGAIAGAALGATCGGMDFGGGCETSVGETAGGALGGAVILGVPGALLGALIGSSTHSERWERVTLARPRVATSPGSFSVSIALAF